jgi:hypothetical protein
MTVCTKLARVHVPNLAKEVDLDAGPMSLIIGPVQVQGPNNCNLPFKVRWKGEPAPDSNNARPRRRITGTTPQDQAKQQADQAKLQSVISSVRLFDAKGRLYQQNGWGGSNNDRSIAYNLNFYYNTNGDDQASPPDHLTCDVPVDTNDTEFPFEFSNVPLP